MQSGRHTGGATQTIHLEDFLFTEVESIYAILDADPFNFDRYFDRAGQINVDIILLVSHSPFKVRNWDYLIVCGQSYLEMVELGDFFIDVKSLPQDGYGLIQLCFLAFVYGYMLMYGSNMISDGSELLLLVPAWAGLVGSVVLPVLGAVPDGCMVLFSGLGPNAQGKRLLLA